jgi:predicted metal-dependent peptidase
MLTSSAKQENRIDRYCAEVKRELPENVRKWVSRYVIYNMLNFEGRHYMSSVAACATPLYGKTHMINFYNSDYLRNMPKESLKAVIAHEIGHLWLGHSSNHDKCAESALKQFEVEADNWAKEMGFDIDGLNEYSKRWLAKRNA